jgi:hypothetical protein
MGIFQEISAAAVLVPVLVAVFVAVAIIFLLTLLFKSVPAFAKLRPGALLLGALLSTAAVTVGITYYLTKLAIEEKGSVEGLKIAEKTIDEKTAQIADQKKIIADLQTKLDAASKDLATAQSKAASGTAQSATALTAKDTDVAALRRRVSDLEATVARQKADLLFAQTRLENMQRFVAGDRIAPIVAADGKLSDRDVEKLGDFAMTIIRPTVRTSRFEVLCPMKYVTPGTTFSLLAGKEALAPSQIDFDASAWRLKLTFYSVDVIESALRFNKSNECTLTAENKANPIHLVATFKRGTTANGWLTSTTPFCLSRLEIGESKIEKTADGWTSKPLPSSPDAVKPSWFQSLRSRLGM